jgi:hypothetical protein
MTSSLTKSGDHQYATALSSCRVDDGADNNNDTMVDETLPNILDHEFDCHVDESQGNNYYHDNNDTQPQDFASESNL